MKTYIIKNEADITQAMFDVCLEKTLGNLRTSTDATPRAVLKWSGTDPPMFSGDTKYNHNEILAEMALAPWNPPM